jgi:hypothetical protein
MRRARFSLFRSVAGTVFAVIALITSAACTTTQGCKRVRDIPVRLSEGGVTAVNSTGMAHFVQGGDCLRWVVSDAPDGATLTVRAVQLGSAKSSAETTNSAEPNARLEAEMQVFTCSELEADECTTPVVSDGAFTYHCLSSFGTPVLDDDANYCARPVFVMVDCGAVCQDRFAKLVELVETQLRDATTVDARREVYTRLQQQVQAAYRKP